MKHWPFFIALALMGMGFHTMFFGHKHFRLTIIFTYICMFFFITMVTFSSFGYLRFLEESHISIKFKDSMKFILLSLVSATAGGVAGKYVDEGAGLITIVVIDVFIVSTAAYMFLMSFTGLWEMIVVIMIAMGASCGYINYRPSFKDQTKIQATACVGAYSLMRGLAMLCGGYPNEG